MRHLSLRTLATAALCALPAVASSSSSCKTDHDCSLNGVCRHGSCRCDPGWLGGDCGVLDARPARRSAGYNLTAHGTSSWCSSVVRDPWDPTLHHLFASEFTHGCGLDYWAPYSRVIRAESRSGPAGPYEFAAEVRGAFAHNPTVVYSPADREWLLYYIGCPTDVVADTCTAKAFSCGPGNANNGESGISVLSSRDLRRWTPRGQVLRGTDDDAWDADVTNPSAWPLQRPRGPHDAAGRHSSAMLLAYRGCVYNCTGGELLNLAVAPRGFEGPYRKVQQQPLFSNPNEDPFIWQDRRGNWHMLMHSLEPEGGFGDGPKVGRHAWAEHYEGPWTFGSKTLAFSTEVEYDDGTKVDFYRRERPQLHFAKDGVTPLVMTTGVQPKDSPMSYTVIVPIGDAGERAQHGVY
ncbi:EGF-like domain-containing protein [Purpureocillium lavendulum]|uniref:EGF-like domain-containing protein n=1 Tax=Purpureocillium lavendulum TaxID=1247861 RepID=A0AB34FRI1_9HYPO|nr:EGF-like domain-containing protein [Purpureocillium lavendulum]